MSLRSIIGVGFALFAALYIIAALHGCGSLTPSDQATVARDGVYLSTCAAVAHACKGDHPDANFSPCWDKFDACMVGHGFFDGGRD